MLILVAGLPGSGKTTAARAYAALYGTLHLNSDLRRLALGLKGHYQPDDKQRVYADLLQETHKALQEGKDIIIDSTFYRASIRKPFVDLANAFHTPLFWIETIATESTIQNRLSRPRPDSEATAEVYQQIKNQFEAIPEPHLVLETDKATPSQLAKSMRQYVTRYDR